MRSYLSLRIHIGGGGLAALFQNHPAHMLAVRSWPSFLRKSHTYAGGEGLSALIENFLVYAGNEELAELLAAISTYLAHAGGGLLDELFQHNPAHAGDEELVELFANHPCQRTLVVMSWPIASSSITTDLIL
jgi:hypothetical protein